jgi:methionyl-tRNA synthetase
MERIHATAAFIFVPGKLTIAHIASTFLPADIYTKLQKAMGKDCILVSATDVHGIWIKRELARTNADYTELIQSFHQKYQEEFKKLNIHFDHYGITNDPWLETTVKSSLSNLHKKGLIKRKNSVTYICQGCNEHLPKRFRLKGDKLKSTGKVDIYNDEDLEQVCSFCQSKDITTTNHKNWFIDLNAGMDQIRSDIEKLKSPQVRNVLLSVLKNELSDWDITRRNYTGFAFPDEMNEEDDLFVYLWYESLIGYLLLANNEPQIKNKFVHFLGKNIVYYHGVIWPYILRQALDDYTTEFDISARGFLDLKKTDERLLGIDSVIDLLGVDYTRFYVAFKVNDNIQDFQFSLPEATDIINNILINRVGAFFNRCRKIIYNSEVATFENVAIDAEIIALVSRKIEEVERSLNNNAINEALNKIIELVRESNNHISTQKYYQVSDEVSMAQVGYLLSVSIVLIRCYVPNIVEDYNIFLNRYSTVHCVLNADRKFSNSVVEQNESIWQKLF